MFSSITSHLVTEYPHAIFGVPFTFTPLEYIVFAALYVSVGMLLWSRITLFGADQECPLAMQERYGSVSVGQAAAFGTVKAFFVLTWIVCLAAFVLIQAFLRANFWLSLARTKTAP